MGLPRLSGSGVPSVNRSDMFPLRGNDHWPESHMKIRVPSKKYCFSKVQVRRGSRSKVVSVSVSIFLISFIILTVKSAAAVGPGSEAKSADLQGKREDLFSSTSKLEDLVEHELQIVELLETFVEFTVSRTNMIKA